MVKTLAAHIYVWYLPGSVKLSGSVLTVKYFVSRWVIIMT